MAGFLKLLTNCFVSKKDHIWRQGDYFITNSEKYVIISLPNRTRNYYEIGLFVYREYPIHSILKLRKQDFDIFIAVYNGKIWSYKFTELLLYIKMAIKLTKNNKDLKKIYFRYKTAAIKIQYAWRTYVKRKQKRAIKLIEVYALHMLYRPGGRLAPTRFKSLII